MDACLDVAGDPEAPEQKAVEESSSNQKRKSKPTIGWKAAGKVTGILAAVTSATITSPPGGYAPDGAPLMAHLPLFKVLRATNFISILLLFTLASLNLSRPKFRWKAKILPCLVVMALALALEEIILYVFI